MGLVRLKEEAGAEGEISPVFRRTAGEILPSVHAA